MLSNYLDKTTLFLFVVLALFVFSPSGIFLPLHQWYILIKFLWIQEIVKKVKRNLSFQRIIKKTADILNCVCTLEPPGAHLKLLFFRPHSVTIKLAWRKGGSQISICGCFFFLSFSCESNVQPRLKAMGLENNPFLTLRS